MKYWNGDCEYVLRWLANSCPEPIRRAGENSTPQTRRILNLRDIFNASILPFEIRTDNGEYSDTTEMFGAKRR